MSKLPAIVVGLGLAGIGGGASAQDDLKDVTFVSEGIIATGMAVELSDQCSSLSARKIRGINFLYSLRSHAFDLGFSRGQVDAYVIDKK